MKTMVASPNDLLGVLVVTWYLASIGSLATQLAVLLWRVRPRLRRHVWVAVIAAVAGVVYLTLFLADVPGILAALQNAGDDIPPQSSARTGALALLLTVSTIGARYLAEARVKL
jgi:hypothetical protein